MPDGHDRNKCALQGPFSPFTLALQDIRNKLITRRDHHKNKTKNGKNSDRATEELNHEYLRQIISISIPRYNSEALPEAYITFPIAACFQGESKKPLLYYSSQYDDQPEKTEKPELDELKEVRKVIENYIVSAKNALDDQIYPVTLEDIIEESSTFFTQYPQSLRKIQGFFRITVHSPRQNHKSETPNSSISLNPPQKTEEGSEGLPDGRVLFHVFFSCQPAGEGEKCALSASCDKDCWKTTIKAFRESFMSSDVRHDLVEILKNVKKINSYSEADDKSQNAHKPEKPGTYNLLRDILSNIQADAVKLIKLPKNGRLPRKDNFEGRKRRAFSVVFVLPYLDMDMDKGQQLNFRYVLTQDQSQLLKNIRDLVNFEKLIEDMEKGSFDSLMGEVKKSKKSIGKKFQIKIEEFSPKPDFRKLVERLMKNVEFDKKNNDVVRDGLSRQVEEHLRTAILLDYAFQGRTKDKVLSEPELDVYMDSVNIEYGGQAFLLDEIFRAKRPDVMISMVNHPSSKLRQCPTQQLINAYEGNYTDETLYPAGLHLLETLLLHPPLFMYPIYQHEAPILLCAFDAALYSGSWQALKSMVDAHTEGIFSAIVSHELDESKKFFNENDNISSMNIPGAADELAERLTYLLLRFCRSLSDLNGALEDEKKVPRVLDHAMTGECVVKIDYIEKIADILIPVLAKKLTVSPDLITQSEHGWRLLQYYVELCVNSFLGVWKVAELSRSEEAHTWAHAINGELSAIQVMFDRFKSQLSKEQQDAFILPERYLAILKSGVHSLMNINRLKKQRDSIFTGSAKRIKLSQVVIESFLVALLRLLSDEDVDYRTSRERLIKTELLIDEGSRTLKDIEPFLKYFNNVAQLTLGNIEEIIKSYFVDTFEFKIDKCRFIEGLFVERKVYAPLLNFVFMEIFFNQFKYMSYDKPEIRISIEGKLFDSDDFLRVSPSTDQPTLLIFSNTNGNRQGGAEIGKSFLLNIAKIGVPQYVESDMLTVKNNSFSVAFPVLVRRE